MRPILDYIYAKEVKTDTGVVATGQQTDTKQKYEVLAVGPGRYEYGNLIEPSVKVGDVVIIQKHAAEGDTPPDMLLKGYALFMASRVMAITDDIQQEYER